MSEHQAKKLFDSMSNISDELVEEACPVKSARQKNTWIKWCAAAACLCLVVGGIFAAIRSTGKLETETENGLKTALNELVERFA